MSKKSTFTKWKIKKEEGIKKIIIEWLRHRYKNGITKNEDARGLLNVGMRERLNVQGYTYVNMRASC